MRSRKPEAAQPLIEQYEPVKARIVELTDLALTGLSAKSSMKQRGFLSAAGPMMLMMLNKMSEQKLTSLLQCFSEIGTVVLDLDCSPEHYQERIIPLIQKLSSYGSED